jgi:hypothetical protein
MMGPTTTPVGGGAQASVDGLLAGALRDLPFMQTTVKLARGYASLGDHRFTRVIAHFLEPLRDIPDAARARFVSSLKTPQEKQRVGETLLVLLDRADDVRKADLLGSLMRGYILRLMSWPTFQTLSDVIDRCSVDDLLVLETLMTCRVVPGQAGTRLLALGLAEQVGDAQVAGYWRPTELGEKLIDLLGPLFA